jgi:short-subunit dehydrogenase
MKTWFITGTSRGFGRARTEAAPERGDRVAVTARTPDNLKDLVERFGDQILPLRFHRPGGGLRSSEGSGSRQGWAT